MELNVMCSGSKGNCYTISNEEEGLILEAGGSFEEFKSFIDFNYLKFKGCLITHEHGDHIKNAKKMISKCGIDTYMSLGTATEKNIDNAKIIECQEEEDDNGNKYLFDYNIGNFNVIPFNAEHNAREPLGFIIEHKEMGRLFFSTDTSHIFYNFAGINNIMIECNYSLECMKNDSTNWREHFSLEKCIRFLNRTDLSNVRNIILLHLSNENSNKNMFIERVKEATGISNVFVAEKGLKIKL